MASVYESAMLANHLAIPKREDAVKTSASAGRALFRSVFLERLTVPQLAAQHLHH